jgi:hypothetical protein
MVPFCGTIMDQTLRRVIAWRIGLVGRTRSESGAVAAFAYRSNFG